ncbi:MAG: hypothetical protein M0Z77_04760 [Thermoplasmatales archaeon]|nr:hypothetical protein [Thermoplasmatales archaeon]
MKKIAKYPSIAEGMDGRSENETIQHIIGLLNRYYGDNPIISRFLSFLEENRGEHAIISLLLWNLDVPGHSYR